MDILNSLRRNIGGEISGDYGGPVTNGPMKQVNQPQTISEIIDAQIKFYENKIADLKTAREAVSPEVERALNALAKL